MPGSSEAQYGENPQRATPGRDQVDRLSAVTDRIRLASLPQE